MSLFSQLVTAYKGFGYSGQQANNIAAVQTVGEGAGLGSGGADAASGGSNGISQWSATRWQNELNWTSSQGLDPRSVAGEAGFTNYELQGAYSNVNTSSVSSLVNSYESPAVSLRAGEIARSQTAADLGSGPASLSMMSPSQQSAGLPGGTTGAQSGGGTGAQPGGSSGSQPGGSSGSATDTSTGTPVNITDPNAIASKAGDAVKAGLGTAATAVDNLTKGTTADTASVTAAGTSWFNFLGNLLSGGTGIFARVGVGMLALILVIAGLWMAGKAND